MNSRVLRVQESLHEPDIDCTTPRFSLILPLLCVVRVVRASHLWNTERVWFVSLVLVLQLVASRWFSCLGIV